MTQWKRSECAYVSKWITYNSDAEFQQFDSDIVYVPATENEIVSHGRKSIEQTI